MSGRAPSEVNSEGGRGTPQSIIAPAPDLPPVLSAELIARMGQSGRGALEGYSFSFQRVPLISLRNG